LVRSTKGLAKKQIEKGKRWLEFFQLHHDKKLYIGKQESSESEAWLEAC
jgi:hypothetical protein